MNQILNYVSKLWQPCVAILCLILAGCADDDTISEAGSTNFAMLTVVGPGTGDEAYLTSHPEEMPSGDVSNLQSTSRQIIGTRGLNSAMGEFLFVQGNSAGEDGIQKLSVSEDGTFMDEGFIDMGTTATSRFVIANEELGFYHDTERGSMKLQLFNPTTMERTGEIDLSSEIDNPDIERVFVGQSLLAIKEGKLYANIHYGTETMNGFLDAADSVVRLAVIDIETQTFESITSLDVGIRHNVCWPYGSNRMWSVDTDGSLYFCVIGLITGGSKIVRVPAGSTALDEEWILDIEDYQINSSFFFLEAKDGQLYTRISNVEIAADFSNLYGEIWDAYVIDIETKAATQIDGIPSAYFAGWTNNIEQIDDKIYYAAQNSEEGINGYFEVNGTSATQIFNVTEGGSVQGLVKLEK